MNKLELQKTAVEVRKGIVSAVHSAKAGHPARQKTCLFCVYTAAALQTVLL